MIKTKEMAQQQREADSQTEYTPVKTNTGVSMPNNLLNAGKKEIIAHAKDIYNAMMDGAIDLVETEILVKKGLLFFETLDENIKPIFYGKTIVSKGDVLKRNNVEIEPSDLGVKWTYHPNPELERLQEDVKVATEALKKHQLMLQTLTTRAKLVDMVTGEEYETIGAVRSATNGYKISIKN